MVLFVAVHAPGMRTGSTVAPRTMLAVATCHSIYFLRFTTAFRRIDSTFGSPQTEIYVTVDEVPVTGASAMDRISVTVTTTTDGESASTTLVRWSLQGIGVSLATSRLFARWVTLKLTHMALSPVDVMVCYRATGSRRARRRTTGARHTSAVLPWVVRCSCGA